MLTQCGTDEPEPSHGIGEAGRPLDRGILISGGAGLLGREVTRQLIAQGASAAQLHHIVRPGGSLPLLGQPHFVGADEQPVPSTLPKSVDAVIHLAQSGGHRDFPSTALSMFRTNLHLLAHLLEYARSAGAQSFLLASSGGVYRPGFTALRENAPLRPTGSLDYYMTTKAAAEAFAQTYTTYMNVHILRIFFMYGHGQRRDMLIPRIFDRVREGRSIQLEGNLGMSLNPVHVADAARVFVSRVDSHESSVLNVAGPETLSIHKICTLMGAYLGREPVFDFVAGKPKDLIGDVSLLTALGLAPKARLADHLPEIDVP